jgi:hypothetical protein
MDIRVVLQAKEDKQQKHNFKRQILANLHVEKHYSMLLKCNLYK